MGYPWATAIAGIGIPCPPAVAPLRRRLTLPDPADRVTAAEALAQIDPADSLAEAVTVLVHVLWTPPNPREPRPIPHPTR